MKRAISFAPAASRITEVAEATDFEELPIRAFRRADEKDVLIHALQTNVSILTTQVLALMKAMHRGSPVDATQIATMTDFAKRVLAVDPSCAASILSVSEPVAAAPARLRATSPSGPTASARARAPSPPTTSTRPRAPSPARPPAPSRAARPTMSPSPTRGLAAVAAAAFAPPHVPPTIDPRRFYN